MENEPNDYYEGDLNAVLETWPPYEPPALGEPYAPNGWSPREGIPITTGDTLASPIGYTAVQVSLWEGVV